ncbi:MAG: response regulator [Alphaproteobacteria bacterium]|nr:MAG: response regulator [Alphaproteobacteria bacterium]
MNQEIIDILLIEDNPSDVELILRALKRNSVISNIHIVSDGAEAVDYFSGTGKYTDRNIKAFPKLVLLDLKLPKVDGLEILRIIKSDLRTMLIPVVILTSSKEECDIKLGYKLGANSFVVKPMDFDKFVSTIQALSRYWILINEPLTQ